MSLLFIHVINSDFYTCDEGAEYSQPADALKVGVRGAVAMLADEINQDKQNAAAEISVTHEDRTLMLRSVVSVSVSPLMLVLPKIVQGTI